MPRTKLSKRFNPTPPIDWLRAAVLERQAVLGYDLKKLSTIGGVSYDSMRHYIRVSPWDWPAPLREIVCKELGITPVRGVAGMPLQSANSDSL